MSAGCRRAAFNVQSLLVEVLPAPPIVACWWIVTNLRAMAYKLALARYPPSALAAARLDRALLLWTPARPRRWWRLATAKGYLNDVFVSPNLTGVRVTQVASGWVKTRAAKR